MLLGAAPGSILKGPTLEYGKGPAVFLLGISSSVVKSSKLLTFTDTVADEEPLISFTLKFLI